MIYFLVGSDENRALSTISLRCFTITSVILHLRLQKFCKIQQTFAKYVKSYVNSSRCCVVGAFIPVLTLTLAMCQRNSAVRLNVHFRLVLYRFIVSLFLCAVICRFDC